jgi:hypothetical protein
LNSATKTKSEQEKFDVWTFSKFSALFRMLERFQLENCFGKLLTKSKVACKKESFLDAKKFCRFVENWEFTRRGK